MGELTDKRLHEIVQAANAWIVCNGMVRKATAGGSEAVGEPYTLFPWVVPSPVIKKLKILMVHFNSLMHKVAMDHEFLEKSLKNVFEVDSFTKKLWDVHCKSRAHGVKQPINLGLFRNDFMIDSPHELQLDENDNLSKVHPKQIEFNTISVDGHTQAECFTRLHNLTLTMAGKTYRPEQYPNNYPGSGFADGLIKTWELKNSQAVIMFIVDVLDKNVFAHRALELTIYSKNKNIRIVHKTLMEVYNAALLKETSSLIVDGDEVAIAYFRTGYSPHCYKTQKEWDARLKIEMSRAIKCPSVAYQLAGTKKIQQELCRPGVLERYFENQELIKNLRSTFASQYSLDMDKEGENAVRLALEYPSKFVLKPQREGGGNNLYNEDIVKFLKDPEMSKQRSGYVLMQKILPKKQKNYLVRRGASTATLTDKLVSEVGIFGVYIGTDETEIMNYECGQSVKAKLADSEEGGICSGYGFYSTIFLI